MHDVLHCFCFVFDVCLVSLHYVSVQYNGGGVLPDILYGHTYSKSMDQPGKVANPGRGQLNRENKYSPVRVRG